MKIKIVKKIILLLLILFLFTGCSSLNDKIKLENDVISLKQQKSVLQNKITELNSKIKLKEKELKGDDIKYYLVLSVRQRHLTLNIGKHIKDAINEFEITIETSRDFYNSIEKGDDLYKSPRWGSFLTEGSIGDWRIKVEKKYFK